MKKLLVGIMLLGSFSLFAQQVEIKISTASEARNFAFKAKEQLRFIAYRIENNYEICTALREFMRITENLTVSEKVYKGDELSKSISDARSTSAYILTDDSCQGQSNYFGNTVDQKIFSSYSDDIYLLDFINL